MSYNRHAFFCIDGHTCGNPLRLVAGGAPNLQGATMSEKRRDFATRFDWIRRALMFEPRGHDVMSGAFLYPPTTPDGDVAILFMETSGCLPMCGHGAIAAVTMGLEQGLIRPKVDGEVKLDTPAGRVVARYRKSGDFIEEVRLTNVASYLARSGLEIDCPGIGPLKIDIAYGGNYYAIVEPQANFDGLDGMNADDILRLSPLVRDEANRALSCVHPEDPTIAGVSHVMWTGAPRNEKAHGRNAVFYGAHAIDRSPCGTGTCARMAQLAARGTLRPGEPFIHESYIGSLFEGRIEERTRVGEFDAIRPSVAGWARMTGLNTIFVDDRDPFKHGFQVL